MSVTKGDGNGGKMPGNSPPRKSKPGKSPPRKSKAGKSSPVQRRASSRIQAAKQKAEVEHQARLEAQSKAAEEVKENGGKSVKRGYKRGRIDESVSEANTVDVAPSKKGNMRGGNEQIVGEVEVVAASSKRKPKSRGKSQLKLDDPVQIENSENAVADSSEKDPALKVKETLRTYNKHYLHFVQEEEKRCQKAKAEREAAKKAKKSKKSKKEAPKEKKTAQRPDLKAVSKMMVNNEILYPKKRFGSIPGIEVGHQFYSRGEMVAVGIHGHWLNGIDYMGKAYAKEYKGNEFPVAVAVVLSGMYEDDLDNAEDIVYTGQGGQDLNGNKRQIRDQKLERGNLALKKSLDQSVPVRVIRGHKSSSSAAKIYTYDGLYKVVQYWAEKGLSGYTVYKYRLRRQEGQPLLTTNQVYFAYGRVPQSTAEIQGLVCEDITGGQENFPIPATNLVDDPRVPPTGFTYCKSVQLAKNVKLPKAAPGCKCKGLCIDPTTCECAKLNGSEFPYVSHNGGRLVEAKDVVFECGPNCGCGPGCVNRTSQNGVKYRLEVFRTAKKGWAVRSWDFIPAGAPVCEYTGILARTDDMDSALENNYIFEIDCLQTIKGLGGRERRSQNVSLPPNLLENCDDKGSENAPEFCIDAGSTGNIARFVNHCCEPNLFVQCVLSTHHDLKFARVMLFAADNIPPLQELTYDYGYELDSVLGSDGKIKQMICYCGAPGCRKRLF